MTSVNYTLEGTAILRNGELIANLIKDGTIEATSTEFNKYLPKCREFVRNTLKAETQENKEDAQESETPQEDAPTDFEPLHPSVFELFPNPKPWLEKAFKHISAHQQQEAIKDIQELIADQKVPLPHQPTAPAGLDLDGPEPGLDFYHGDCGDDILAWRAKNWKKNKFSRTYRGRLTPENKLKYGHLCSFSD